MMPHSILSTWCASRHSLWVGGMVRLSERSALVRSDSALRRQVLNCDWCAVIVTQYEQTSAIHRR